MAERRMFSKRIINSARFLKMPVSTQLLYFHLGIHADDDGVVEAYTVMNAVGCTEDDLKVLVAKGFAVVLNEDLVTYITDWKENNKIRSDRKVDSIYKDLLLQIVPDADILQPRRRADYKKKVIDSGDFDGQDTQRTSCGHTTDVLRTHNGRQTDSIGKDRLGKDSIGKDNIYCGSDEPNPLDGCMNPPECPEEEQDPTKPKKEKPVKHKYGEYRNVLLTDEELDKLKTKFPDWENRIENLSLYIESKGARYKSHYATILSWHRREIGKGQKTTGNGQYEAHRGNVRTGSAEDLDGFYKMMADFAQEGGE